MLRLTRKFSVKFTNKAKSHLVIVKHIQVDWVYMKGMQLEYKWKTHWYILSLMDSFSRFHWLAPLERKKSSFVDKELKWIYTLHGIRKRIQNDNVGKFKKDVELYRKKNKIKMIRCRPYNSKAQEKVERSHRVLWRHIYYDLIKKKKTRANWVKCLPKYIKCLNQEKRGELGWNSDFEIYFGRKANKLKNEGKEHDNTIHLLKTVGPSAKDFKNQKHN